METILPSRKSRFSFLKSSLFIAIFFAITPLALLSSIVSLVALAKESPTPPSYANLIQAPESGVQVYASLPSSFPSVSGQVLGADARVELIRQYLDANNSDLEPYANLLVRTADKYDLDYRLLTAIAQKESGLCRVIPENSHNCWGWGIHSKGTLKFDNYPEAIETVSKGLKEKYIDLGYTTVDDIMTKYAHPDSTTWADGVKAYMDQIQ